MFNSSLSIPVIFLISAALAPWSFAFLLAWFIIKCVLIFYYNEHYGTHVCTYCRFSFSFSSNSHIWTAKCCMMVDDPNWCFLLNWNRLPMQKADLYIPWFVSIKSTYFHSFTSFIMMFLAAWLVPAKSKRASSHWSGGLSGREWQPWEYCFTWYLQWPSYATACFTFRLAL